MARRILPRGLLLLKPSEHGVGRLIGDIEFRDLSDKNHQLSQWRERRAIAVCMTSTTCPLSKKYLPTLIDLAKSFGPRGVQFVVVNTVATDDRTAMREAAAQLSPHAVYVADPDEKFAQAVGAKSTTDVIVLDATRTVVYHGAVENLFRRLDRNADGALDRDELSKLVELMQRGRAGEN